MIPKSKIEALLNEIEQGIGQLEVSLQNAVVSERQQVQTMHEPIFQENGSRIEEKMSILEHTLFHQED